MIDGLKPYPAYKPVRLKWTDAIPSHWDVKRPKTFLVEIEDRSTTGTETLLSMRMQAGLVPFYQVSAKIIPPQNLIGYKRTRPGDIVLNRMQASNGMFARTLESGLVSPDYAVLRPIAEVDVRYLTYLFKTPVMRARFRGESKGLGTGTAGFLRLYSDRLFAMNVVFPPPEEQIAIADFLDMHAGLVSKFVRTKRRQIQLLNDQRTARAVEILSQGTVGARLVRLRYICSKFGSGVTPLGGATNYVESGIPFLRSQNVHFEDLRLDDVAYIPFSIHQSMSGTHVRPGDTLLNITGASIGRVCSVPNDLGEANVNQHVCIIRPASDKLDSRYLAAYLALPSMQYQIYTSQNGASREGLAIERLKGFAIALPPLERQRDLVQEIEVANSDIARATGAANREIDLVRECRTRVIADLVVGGVDVRSAAVSLVQSDLQGDEDREDLAQTEEDVEGLQEVAVGDE